MGITFWTSGTFGNSLHLIYSLNSVFFELYRYGIQESRIQTEYISMGSGSSRFYKAVRTDSRNTLLFHNQFWEQGVTQSTLVTFSIIKYINSPSYFKYEFVLWQTPLHTEYVIIQTDSGTSICITSYLIHMGVRLERLGSCVIPVDK